MVKGCVCVTWVGNVHHAPVRMGGCLFARPSADTATGRNIVFVDQRPVLPRASARLASISTVDVGGARLLVECNEQYFVRRVE